MNIEVSIIELGNIRKAVDNFSQAVSQSLTPAIARLRDALNEIDPLIMLDELEKVDAFRDYAGRYNAVHQWRKISWRHLTRQQERDAAWYYIHRNPELMKMKMR